MEQDKIDRALAKALEYSRKVPKRQCSPYGYLDTDYRAIKDAFRLCYEVLQQTRKP